MFANVAKMHGPTNMACSCAVSWKTRFFFSCHLARFAWSVVHEASGQLWNPASGADLLDILRAQYGSNRRIRWRCVGVLLWALWTVKNKITIELIFKCHPADCIFKCHLSAAVDSAGEMSGRWSHVGRDRKAPKHPSHHALTPGEVYGLSCLFCWACVLVMLALATQDQNYTVICSTILSLCLVCGLY